MSDLDFDELDKAVNGMIEDEKSETDGTEPDAEVKKETKDKEEKPKKTEKKEEKTEDKAEKSKKSKKAKVAASSLDIPSRRGRFMDVMHPNHDMKKRVPNLKFTTVAEVKPMDKNLAAEVAKEAAKEPVKTDVSAEMSALLADGSETPAEGQNEASEANFKTDSTLEEKVVTEEKIDEVAGGDVQPKEEAEAVDGDEPDLSDFNLQDENVENKATLEEEKEDAPVLAEKDEVKIEETPEKGALDMDALKEDDTEEEADDEAGYTPFLPDAKVEKRPLGDVSKSIEDEINSTDSVLNPTVVDAAASGNMFETEVDAIVVEPKRRGGGWIWLLVVLLVILVGAAGGAAIYFFMFN